MLDLNDLYYFAQVVDRGGFAAAGRALSIPRSKLSRRIALLEDQLGVRLLQRSTRHFSVTDAGQTFYAHCKAMQVEAEAAQEALAARRSEPRGLVRMTCPVALLQTRVGPMVAEFLVQCPRVTVELKAYNRPVDVIAEGWDLAIRVREPPFKDSDLVLKTFARRSQCLVASPSLLAQANPPLVPADLALLPSLDSGPMRHDYHWELDGSDGSHATIRHTPRLVTDDMVTLRAAAVAGVGVAHLPTMMVSEALRQGSLIRLLPDWSLKSHVIHAVLPTKRYMLPAVRALVDFLAERFAALDED